MAVQQQFVDLDPETQDLRRFRCGKPTMDRFLRSQALAHRALGLSHTWVLLDEDLKGRKKHSIAAYFALANNTLAADNLPKPTGMPRYQIPVILIARLAVSQDFQGRKLGTKTLITAIRKAVQLADKGLPVHGILLDVLDDEALAFYRRFDFFQAVEGEEIRLFLPMSAARQL